MYYWVLWEINFVLKAITSTDVPWLGLFAGFEYAWLHAFWLKDDGSWKIKSTKKDAVVHDIFKWAEQPA